MDAGSARDRVRLLIDREDTAYLSNGDVDGFVVMAIEEFVQQYYGGFEVTQDNREKLAKLVDANDITISDSVPYALSGITDYYRLLSAQLSASPFANVKVIQISDLSAYTNDPFNKADADNPVIYLSGDKINSLGLSGTTTMSIKYLKYADAITDLAVETHEEVCQIAARKVLATLGDPRYQILQAELTERRV